MAERRKLNLVDLPQPLLDEIFGPVTERYDFRSTDGDGGSIFDGGLWDAEVASVGRLARALLWPTRRAVLNTIAGYSGRRCIKLALFLQKHGQQASKSVRVVRANLVAPVSEGFQPARHRSATPDDLLRLLVHTKVAKLDIGAHGAQLGGLADDAQFAAAVQHLTDLRLEVLDAGSGAEQGVARLVNAAASTLRAFLYVARESTGDESVQIASLPALSWIHVQKSSAGFNSSLFEATVRPFHLRAAGSLPDVASTSAAGRLRTLELCSPPGLDYLVTDVLTAPTQLAALTALTDIRCELIGPLPVAHLPASIERISGHWHDGVVEDLLALVQDVSRSPCLKSIALPLDRDRYWYEGEDDWLSQAIEINPEIEATCRARGIEVTLPSYDDFA